MLDHASKNALRSSLMTYLLGKTSGRSRIQSRANGLNLSAYYLYWPNHTLSFELVEKKIDASSIDIQLKNDLKEKFQAVKGLWKTEIETTITSIARSFEKSSNETDGDSQSTEPTIIEGLVLPSDLPKGSKMNVADELIRYRQISKGEFLTCKNIKYYCF